MNSGSTVNDQEVVAAMLLSEGFFSSGGGFSNIFPSDCYLFDIRSWTLTR